MNWWQQLKQNNLARLGSIILIILYLVSFGAEFVAPYSPYESQKDGSLLPPTAIHFNNPEGVFLGPHVYPITQGKTDINTGERALKTDFDQPSPIRFLVKGEPYRFLRAAVPPLLMNTIFKGSVTKQDFVIFPGFISNLHLFGTEGNGRINLLGTDEQGRDQFTRLLYGSRISLCAGLIGILISFPIGTLVGGIAGYFGGWADTILMRIVEVLMTIPTLYLLVTIAGILPPGLSSSERFLLIIAITSFIGWASLARVVRGQVLSIKEREFVQAAKVLGANPFYIILRHVLPQTASYLIISSTLAIPGFIISEAILSLIGLGIQQPDPSWGNMLSLGANTSILTFQPWLVWPPALLIILVVLSFNLLGDGLRDALDPRSVRR